MCILHRIWLDPRFFVSKEGICVNPLKFDVIVNFPPPSSLHQLQSLQGKFNFLHRFVPNYIDLAKGFTRLLKNGMPFVWDEISQNSFDALKQMVINAPLFHPPDYHHIYFPYLVATSSAISMVLV